MKRLCEILFLIVAASPFVLVASFHCVQPASADSSSTSLNSRAVKALETMATKMSSIDSTLKRKCK